MKLRALKIIALHLLLTSCNLINLRELQISTYPSQRNQIISNSENIWIEFSEDLIQHDAEGLFKVTHPSGQFEGELSWEGRRLIFRPLREWTKAIRYTFSFKGTIVTTDGRKYRTAVIIPFHVASRESPAVLESYSPKSGSIIGVFDTLNLNFSKTMDQNNFEENFSMSPSAEILYEWSGNGMSVGIKPKTRWNNLNQHRWTISREIYDSDSIPIAMKYSDTFMVQKDVLPPRVTSIHPAVLQADAHYEKLIGLGLENLDNRNDIFFTFNEEVDFQSLNSAFSIHPDIDGHFKQIDGKQFVYVKGRNFEAEREYRITLKDGLSDISGNRISEDIEYVFTPAIPALNIASVRIQHKNGSKSAGAEHFNTAELFRIPGLRYYGLSADEYSLYFSITIDQPYTKDEIKARQNFVQGLSCQLLFPKGKETPSLSSISWNSSGTVLTLKYTKFTIASDANPVYYRFTILKGSPSTANAAGSYSKEDISFVFHAQGMSP